MAGPLSKSGMAAPNLKTKSAKMGIKNPSMLSSLRAKQISLFFLTYLAYTALYSTRKPFSVVKSTIQSELHLERSQLAAIDTAFLGFYAAGQMVIPPISQKYAEAKTILLISYVGSCFAAIAFSMCLFATPMIFVWVLNGIFHASVYPLLVRSLAPWFDSISRGAVFSTWTTAQQSGSLVATAFASFAAAKFGWRSTFFIPGVIVGIVGIILYSFLPHSSEAPDFTTEENPHCFLPDSSYERKMVGEGLPRTPRKAMKEMEMTSSLNSSVHPTHPRRNVYSVPSEDGVYEETIAFSPNDEYQEKGGDHEDVPLSVSQILQIPDLTNAAAAYFCIKCVRYSLLFWLPYYLVQRLDFSVTNAGYSSTVFDIGGIPGAIFYGILSDRVFHGRRLLAATIMALVTAAGILLFAAASGSGNSFLTVVTMAVVGFSLAGPDSALGAAAAQDICDRSIYGMSALAVAAGLVNGMGSSGAVVQGFLTSFISEKFGWDVLFGTLSGILLLSVGCLVPTLRREAQSKVSARYHPEVNKAEDVPDDLEDTKTVKIINIVQQQDPSSATMGTTASNRIGGVLEGEFPLHKISE